MPSTIVCGTDFSAGAAEAATTAAAVAVKRKLPLHLIHASELLTPEDGGPGRPAEDLLAAMRAKLGAEAARLRETGASVESAIVQGVSAAVIVGEAEKRGAELVFVSSVGRRGAAKWLLGSVAEEVLRKSRVPVIVVRSSAPFVQWTKGTRPLRVLLGVENSDASVAAARWLTSFRSVGPIDVVVGHVCWPKREQDRPALDAAGRPSEVDPRLRREFTEQFGPILGSAGVRFRVQPGYGRSADHLILIAAEEKADMIVLGTHRRRGIDRLWYGSVSYGVAQLAPMSVACVPLAAVAGESGPVATPKGIPELRSVVAATDFSESGNRVVAHALSILPKGGVVHVLHVLEEAATPNPLYAHYSPGPAPTPEERAKRLADARAALEALVPKPEAASRGIEVKVEVVESGSAVEAILAAAERLDADALCVGSHGRSGIARALLGSVAEACLRDSTRPVYVVRR